jgi:RTX calcium-binding nonapeptide repeat (4 copies)
MRQLTGRLTVAAVATAILLLAGPAGATTASRIGDQVIVTAGPGETNSIYMDTFQIPHLRVDDHTAGITAGPGCTQVNPIQVTCPIEGLNMILIDAGDGNDQATEGAPFDAVLRGGPGDDVLHSLHGDELIDGGSGDDLLNGSDGRNVLLGRGGNDRLRGSPGPDLLRGQAGADILTGGAGPDVLRGGSGNDLLRGKEEKKWPTRRDILDGDSGTDKADPDSRDVVRQVEKLV